MKLKDDFFKIQEAIPTGEGMDYNIRLNPEHAIYAAHFPGNPITPGVCIIQMVKELTEEIRQESLFLHQIKNVKFLEVIHPLQHAALTISLSVQETEGECKVNAHVSGNGTAFAKLSLQFTKV